VGSLPIALLAGLNEEQGGVSTPVLVSFVCQLDTAGVITEKGASLEEMPP